MTTQLFLSFSSPKEGDNQEWQRSRKWTILERQQKAAVQGERTKAVKNTWVFLGSYVFLTSAKDQYKPEACWGRKINGLKQWKGISIKISFRQILKTDSDLHLQHGTSCSAGSLMDAYGWLHTPPRMCVYCYLHFFIAEDWRRCWNRFFFCTLFLLQN